MGLGNDFAALQQEARRVAASSSAAAAAAAGAAGGAAGSGGGGGGGGRTVDDLRQALKVGVHKDVQVTSMKWGAQLVGPVERPGRGYGQVLRVPRTITQVLTAAPAIAYNERTTPAEKWLPLATLILDGAFEATLHAALASMSRHGCGCMKYEVRVPE